MRRNNGVIGPRQTPTTSSASGTFDTLDVTVHRANSIWPLTLYYLSATSSSYTVTEGSTITITVTTSNLLVNTSLYYTITSVGGTVNTSDFTDAALSGVFTQSASTQQGSFTKTLALDGTSEPGDAFQVQIRTGSILGPIVVTSPTITISNPTFSLAPVAASYNEGDTVQFQFSATNLNGGTYYWRTSAAADDVTSGATSGTFSYTPSLTSTVSPYTLKRDMITEGNETHTISIYDPTNTYLLTSTIYTAVDTSTAPTIAVSSTAVNEGDTVTFTVTFANGPTSGTIYWGTSGTVVANNFTNNTLSGSATITASGSNGTATITRTVRRDFVTGGSKTFALNLYRDGPATTLVATSSTVTITDTCQAPTITLSSSSINEGDTVTFTVTTTGVADNTVLPYTLNLVSGQYFASTEVTDGLLYGTITIINNSATLSKTWANDGFTEGTQTFNLTLKPPAGDAFSSSTIATSPTLTVADTSNGNPLPALYPFTSFQFGNAGLLGRTGPTLAQCLASYNTTANPWLTNTAYFNMTSQGIQRWTVPKNGTYRITAVGARGGGGQTSSNYGLPAKMQSDFTLTAGDIIQILVGQLGNAGNITNTCGQNGGGGGGTFVATSANVALLVAGGGGGGGNITDPVPTRKHASTTTSGNKADGTNGGPGGTGGGGGSTQINSCVTGGAAGAGFLTNGATNGQSTAAAAFVNGGTGGAGGYANGGFGGGGASGTSYAAGGGGGYSGGGGGGLDACACASMGHGGGGGSYSANATVTATAQSQENPYVTIEFIG